MGKIERQELGRKINQELDGFHDSLNSTNQQLAQTVKVSNPKTVTEAGITEAISKLTDETYDTLVLEKGEYSASLLSNIPSNTEIVFTKGARIIPDAENEIIQIKGTAPTSYISLSADLTISSYVVSVSDTSMFSVGDWVHIRSGAILDGINGYSNMTAEMRKIEKINTDSIVLNEGVCYDFLTVDSAEIGVATVKENIKLVNINIGEYGFTQKFFRGIHLSWTANIEIHSPYLIGSRDVEGVDLQARDGITVSNSYRVSIYGPYMNNIGWYGVAYGGCTQHLYVKDGHFEKCRHASSALYIDGAEGYGEPHDVVFEDCSNYNSTLSGFDTHDTGKNIEYINCKSIGSGDNGFQIRNDGNVKLINCEAKYSAFDGVKINSGSDVSKQIQRVIIDGGEYSHNSRYGINSDARICNVIGNPIITDNVDSGILTFGGTIDCELMTRNGNFNGAIRYGSVDKPFLMNWVIVQNTHFIKDNQNSVVVASLATPSEIFKKLKLINNIYENYDDTGSGAILYASNSDGTSLPPLSIGNHYNTDFGTQQGIATLVGGSATISSSYVLRWEPTTYRGVKPIIELQTITDAGVNTGYHFISDIATGTFTISSTNANDTSQILWKITY